MQYIFRVQNPEDPGFLREYSIPSGYTFHEFHKFLQGDLALLGMGIASFYTTKGEDYEPNMELTEMDMGDDTILPSLQMAEVRVRDLVSGEGDKFLYAFDLLNERALLLDLVRIDRDAEERVGILCIRREGENPEPSPDPFVSTLDDIEEVRRILGESL